MRRGRLLIILAIVILLGVAAVVLLMRTLGQPAGDQGPEGQPAPVNLTQIVIAAKDISRGSVIADDDVVVSPFPRDLVVETMVTDKDQVVGQRARMDIGRGVPVTLNMVTEWPGDMAEAGSSAAFAIPPGQTAIAIPMTRLSGVAYALKDGDQVDVLVTLLMVDVDAEFQTSLPNRLSVLYASGGTADDPAPSLTAPVTPQDSGKGRTEVDPGTGQRIYVVPAGEQRARLVTQRLVTAATVLHVGTFPLERELGEEPEAPPVEEGAGAPSGQAGTEVQATVAAEATRDTPGVTVCADDIGCTIDVATPRQMSP